jgi:hypothetical protein
MLLVRFSVVVLVAGFLGTAQAAPTLKEVQTLLPFLEASEAAMKPLISQAKKDELSFDSSTLDGDAGQMSIAAGQLALSVDAANREVFSVCLLMDRINTQYPDTRQVYNVGPDGVDAAALIDNMNRVLKKWDDFRLSKATQYLEKSEGELMMVSQTMETLKTIPANVRGTLVGQHISALQSSKVLLDVVPALLPEPPEGMDKRTPEMENLVAKAAQVEEEYRKVESQMIELSDSADRELKKQLEEARFPKGLQRNAADEKEVLGAYKKVHGDVAIRRIGIKGDWQVKKEAYWKDNVLRFDTYRYIGVWIAQKTDSDKFFVYSLSFRKKLQPDGSWGPLEQWGVGHVYEILEKNIDL